MVKVDSLVCVVFASMVFSSAFVMDDNQDSRTRVLAPVGRKVPGMKFGHADSVTTGALKSTNIAKSASPKSKTLTESTKTEQVKFNVKPMAYNGSASFGELAGTIIATTK